MASGKAQAIQSSDDKVKKQSNPEIKEDIQFIKGHTNLFLIAPHGHEKDDKNTGKLVRLIAGQNRCYALINEFYRKPDDDNPESKRNRRVNLNDIDQVRKHLKEEFLDPLLKYKNEIVKTYGNAIIIWIHGADDGNLKDDISKTYDADPGLIKVLIGWGQKKNRNRHTAQHENLSKLVKALNENGLDTVLANPEKKIDLEKGISSYCGWAENNMNQLFRVGNNQEYQDPNVDSFQLEFRMKDCRKKEDLQATSEKLMPVLSSLVSPPIASQALTVYEPLVEKVYQKLASIFLKNYEQALMEAGQYIVRTFYGGEENIEEEPYNKNFKLTTDTVENARHNNSQRKETLNQLYERMGQDPHSKIPSKAWIYNAVNLIVQWHDMKKELKSRFYTYRNLLLSQKNILLRTKKIPIKLILCEEENKKKSTVGVFKKRFAELESSPPEKPLTLPALLKKPKELIKEENAERLSLEALKNTQTRSLEKLKNITEDEHKNIQTKIESLNEDLEKRQQFLEKYVMVKANIEQAIEFKMNPPKKETASKVKGK